MVKVTDFSPNTTERELMLKALKVEDLYTGTVINRKDIIWHRRSIEEFINDSYFKPCSDLWNNLDAGMQTKWNNAGAICNMTGFQLFVQDTSYRLKNNKGLLAIPNLKHQYKAIGYQSDDDSKILEIIQHHYPPYKLKTLIPGSKKGFEWVEINEPMPSSLLLEFNYCANVELTGAPNYLHVSVVFWGDKDGEHTYQDEDVDLDLVTDWKLFSHTFSNTLDTIDQYQVEIHGYNCKGEAYFDNFNIEHNGENWAFDPYCDDIFGENLIRATTPTSVWHPVMSYTRDIVDSKYYDKVNFLDL